MMSIQPASPKRQTSCARSRPQRLVPRALQTCHASAVVIADTSSDAIEGYLTAHGLRHQAPDAEPSNHALVTSDLLLMYMAYEVCIGSLVLVNKRGPANTSLGSLTRSPLPP